VNFHKKRRVIIALTAALLLALLGSASARTVWVTGTVTKGPWIEKYRHIEVDNVKYTLMPNDVRIERLLQTYSGIWQRESVLFGDIREGQKIMINIQGHRIYQIVIED